MKDIYDRAWIIDNARKILPTYSEGITLRQLYYRLVAIGMTNDVKHYKKVVSALTEARWNGDVEMTAFIDRERSVYGRTQSDTKDLNSEIEYAKERIQSVMEYYRLERWSNQENYVEVWIEKKALQGVFEYPCSAMSVSLSACKGYPSLTFLNDAKVRFQEALDRNQNPIILYFGDYDPSGEDIPRSIKDNLSRLGVEVSVERIALNPKMIQDLKLPSVPPKVTDSRTRSWDGKGAVELDAVDPSLLSDLCKKSIRRFFDEGKYSDLKETESDEREEFIDSLKEYVKTLK